MEIIILGSGGFQTIPQPGCQCKICQKARNNSAFSRTGPSIYLPALDVLIDTPCESKCQLNKLGHLPTNVIYSHWHPDHTEGWRVLESFPDNVKVHIPPDSMLVQRVPGLEFLEKTGRIRLIDWKPKTPIKKNGYELRYLLLDKQIPVYGFLYISSKKKALICPDHSRFLLNVNAESIKDLNLLIMNMGVLKDKKPDVTQLSDNLKIIEKFAPRQTVLTHIEEHFGIDNCGQKQLGQKDKTKNYSLARDFQKIIV